MEETRKKEVILALKELKDWEGLPYCIEEPMQNEGIAVITNEALDVAIKALEQQSSDDCISRAYIESIVEELENICINGDDYILSLLSRLKNAPPVTPEPFINKPCISEGVCREDKMQTLDKIRAEIAEYGSICVTYAITDKTKTDEGIDELVTDVLLQAKRQMLDIIDKYKAESEEKNEKDTPIFY